MMETQKDKQQKNTEAGEREKRPIPAGLPYLAAGGVFFLLAMLLPVYRLWALILNLVFAVMICTVLAALRRKQIAALPAVTPMRERAEELSRNLDAGRDQLRALQPQIRSGKVSKIIESMANTLEKLADNLEKNPKDRNKIRKVAVHYVPMITDLVRNYANLEQQGVDGANISATMTSIENGLEKIDESLKQYLDDMFEDDKISIETDIEVLKQLMNRDDDRVNKMNFDEIIRETNGGKENV